MSLGAVDYIAKPFSPAIVRPRVNTHMRLKRKTDREEHNHEALFGFVKANEACYNISIIDRVLGGVDECPPDGRRQ